MSIDRRDFVRLSALTGGAAALGYPSGLLAKEDGSTEPHFSLHREVEQAENPMRILVLGGTGFIGPPEVEYMLARGHTVTLFNRGRTNANLFPGVEKLRGDRQAGDLDALRGREWDAVIDNPATVPRWVRESARLLKDAAEYYVHVSTVSVYSDDTIVGLTEDEGPVFELEDPTVEQVTGETYGGMKVLCEREAQRAFPGRAIIVRPGLIVGPGDPSDRFTYWPMRIAKGGEVLAPGDGTDPNQIIDARDLGEWIVRLVENGAAGVYNATGPSWRMSMAEMLYGIRAVTDGRVKFTWVDWEFMQEHEVSAWMDMPTWFPFTPEMQGLSTVDVSRAVAAGLTFRPLAVTARDTLEWVESWSDERKSRPRRFGISPEREAEVLQAWHERTG